MNTIFEPGYCLKDKEHNYEYEIIKIIGRGTTSAVYLAKEKDSEHYYLIKEFNPVYIELIRDQEGVLLCKNTCMEKRFNEIRVKYNESIKLQRKLRNNKKLCNYICDIYNYFEENNTTYYVMSVDMGSTYDQIKEKEVCTLFKRIRRISEVIGYIHEAGFICGDIKPENIFVYGKGEDPNFFLFDFDSFCEIDTFDRNLSSYTPSWAAPEILINNSELNKSIDFYAIGEILFFKLFNRHSNINEHLYSTKYDFSGLSELNINKYVKERLSVFFKKTICSNPQRRFENAEELLCILDEIINSYERKYYLYNYCPGNVSIFAGRDNELRQISEAFKMNHVVVLSGIDGIGKTALAKAYGNKVKNNYDSIIFLTYDNSWKDLVESIYSYLSEDIDCGYEQNRFISIIKILRTIIADKKNKVLFIVDDAGWINDDASIFLELNADFLLIPKISLDYKGYPNIVVREINDMDVLENLFSEWSEQSIYDGDEKEAVYKICEYYDYNTLAIEIIAKQCRFITKPSERWYEIKKLGLQSDIMVDTDLLDHNETRALGQIKSIFDDGGLNSCQQQILFILSVLPRGGVEYATLERFVEISRNKHEISLMLKQGWIKLESERIKIHPLIAAVIQDIYSNKLQCIDGIISSIIENKDSDYGLNALLSSYEERNLYSPMMVNMFKIIRRYNLYSDSIVYFLAEEVWDTLLWDDEIYSDDSITEEYDCLGIEVYKTALNMIENRSEYTNLKLWVWGNYFLSLSDCYEYDANNKYVITFKTELKNGLLYIEANKSKLNHYSLVRFYYYASYFLNEIQDYKQAYKYIDIACSIIVTDNGNMYGELFHQVADLYEELDQKMK